MDDSGQMTYSRAATDDVAGHGDVGREDPPRFAFFPLVLLGDVALHQADADRSALARQRAISDAPGSPRPDTDQNERRGTDCDDASAARCEQCERQRGVDVGHQRRQTVDAKDAGQLRHREHRDLAVSKRHPRKPAEDVATREFGCHPRDGREEQAARAGPRDETTGDECRQCRVDREVERQQEHREGRHRHVQLAKRDEHSASPVDRADEIRRARRQAKRQRAERRLSRQFARTPAPTRERHEQRNECNPGKRRMAILRETKREQDARD